MYGIDGIDHLTSPGQIKRVIAGSYPSGPSSATPPKIVTLIEDGAIEAYNIPSGILFQLHRASAVGQPGVLTEVGKDTFMDPRRNGGRMNAQDHRGHRARSSTSTAASGSTCGPSRSTSRSSGPRPPTSTAT